ncbi:hypothetical protein [Mesorhizobium sp.]|uniref:hypothetical protein n=1 Tax=Mesorhizobium sp. TaxID=1871066 RepID=UPI003BA9B9C6
MLGKETNRGRLAIVVTGLALAFACSSSMAYGAQRCSPKSYHEAQSAMTRRLLATGYSKTQVNFLMRNADRITSALPADKLDGNAKACGIDSAKAYVFGCLDKQLFPLKSGTNALLDDEKQTKGFWGRKRLTVRELRFIGGLHGCLGAAKESLFRG